MFILKLNAHPCRWSDRESGKKEFCVETKLIVSTKDDASKKYILASMLSPKKIHQSKKSIHEYTVLLARPMTQFL